MRERKHHLYFLIEKKINLNSWSITLIINQLIITRFMIIFNNKRGVTNDNRRKIKSIIQNFSQTSKKYLTNLKVHEHIIT